MFFSLSFICFYVLYVFFLWNCYLCKENIWWTSNNMVNLRKSLSILHQWPVYDRSTSHFDGLFGGRSAWICGGLWSFCNIVCFYSSFGPLAPQVLLVLLSVHNILIKISICKSKVFGGVASKVEVTFSGFSQVKLVYFCNPSQLRIGVSSIITVQYWDHFLKYDQGFTNWGRDLAGKYASWKIH